MSDNPFPIGTIVEHASLGAGRVIAFQGDRLHVYFHNKGGKCATRLGLDTAKKLLRAAPVQVHEWLDHLPAFTFDSQENAYCLEHGALTQAQAIATFMAMFPAGFDDPRYIGTPMEGERRYKDDFAAEWSRSFGQGEGERLLAAGDVPELSRRLLRVAQINLLHPNWDKAPLKDGLTDEKCADRFFRALLAAVADGPSEATFEALVGSLAAMPTPGSAVSSWPVVTIFPWLARPHSHMFVRPSQTQAAANRLGFEINYQSTPNWRTYRSVLALSKVLLGELRQYQARDYLDVQGFMFVTGGKNITY